MSQLSNVTIVMVRCTHTRQPYGIRFEELSRGNWVGNWAFAIREDRANREGYDRGEIKGSFGFSEGYPGCPHCQASNVVKCGKCGQLSCWDTRSNTMVCPYPNCGNRGEISGSFDRLSAGGDR